ncbi:MAG TPA: mercury methylation corrinoid protein HgcA, partial [Bacteroidales bacterium]|nr:mercury methylation corrinoid protein HgcA [Bacteroidales bacterium]
RGFNVVFGPVRAADIRAFIANGYKATPGMRKVTFNFTDRIKLIPVDFVYAGSKLLAAFVLIFLLSGLNREGISISQAIDRGLSAMLYISLAYVTGIFVTPVLLPYIPVRMFAFKGFITGLALSVILCIFNMPGRNIIEVISWFLLISAVSSFMAMNFTGSSTFTSLSGVKREMRIFVPVQISSAAIGLVLFVISNFKN